jgi:hypothetical protein
MIGGDTAPDDCVVLWNDLPIGRVLKQPGVSVGRPNWALGRDNPRPTAAGGVPRQLQRPRRVQTPLQGGVGWDPLRPNRGRYRAGAED